jgi:rRNA maturation protein Nop10
MTVTYKTTIDVETRETVDCHASTTYTVACPECGHQFRTQLPACREYE